MKRRRIYRTGLGAGMLLVLTILAGCGAYGEQEGTTVENKEVQTSEMPGKMSGEMQSELSGEISSEEKTVLTEDQIQILVSAGFGEGRLRDGELTNLEWRILSDYSYALETLQEKYGDEGFELTECSPAKADADTIFWGNADAGAFEIHVTGEIGSQSAADSYYGVLMQGAYENLLREKLVSWDIQAVTVDVTCESLYDASYTADLLPSDAIAQGKWLSGSGYLTLQAEGLRSEACGELLEELKQHFIEEGLTGSFRVTMEGSTDAYSERMNIFESEVERRWHS